MLPKAAFYLSCEDKGDMIILVDLLELDKDGKSLMHLRFPIDDTSYKSTFDIPRKAMASLILHLGSKGIMRASHRAFVEKRSIHSQL